MSKITHDQIVTIYQVSKNVYFDKIENDHAIKYLVESENVKYIRQASIEESS